MTEQLSPKMQALKQKQAHARDMRNQIKQLENEVRAIKVKVNLHPPLLDPKMLKKVDGVRVPETPEERKERIQRFADALTLNYRDQIAALKGEPLPSGKTVTAQALYGHWQSPAVEQHDDAPLHAMIRELSEQKERLWKEVIELHQLVTYNANFALCKDMSFIPYQSDAVYLPQSIENHWYHVTADETWAQFRDGKLTAERSSYLLGVPVDELAAKLQEWLDQIPF